jgi:antitoxin component YwqK of YwqJK toxin-antitoxin module
LEHGKFVQYFINGQVNIKTTNQNGVLNGEYISYNSDGTVFYSGFYINGLRSGEWKYFNNGVLDTIIHE